MYCDAVSLKDDVYCGMVYPGRFVMVSSERDTVVSLERDVMVSLEEDDMYCGRNV